LITDALFSVEAPVSPIRVKEILSKGLSVIEVSTLWSVMGSCILF
jgi:hypothetical protein